VKSTKRAALAILTIVAAFGCAPADDNNDADSQDNNLIFGTRSIDQAGVVEASTMMLAALPTPLLDTYNQEDPFGIRPAGFRDTFTERFAKFDAYDGTPDWTAAQAATWTKRMSSANYLVVDTSKPCNYANPRTYLEIERAQLTGQSYATCGGRMPNEDAMDVTLNFLIRGPSATAEDNDAIHDGVDQPTTWAGDIFPYLAEFND
jgi:hypothetical protein